MESSKLLTFLDKMEDLPKINADVGSSTSLITSVVRNILVRSSQKNE